MHGMDAVQWDWRDKKIADKSLSKTQFANLKADQARSMNESLNRGYWHEEDWERGDQGFWGSGRSRTDDRGRPMWQDPSTTNTLREQAIQNKYQSPSPPQPNKPTHHFDDGGIAGLPGQWSPSTIEGDEETFDIKTLGLDPGIMSIDDLEALFEEVGLDKRIIHDLINTGGLSQLVV